MSYRSTWTLWIGVYNRSPCGCARSYMVHPWLLMGSHYRAAEPARSISELLGLCTTKLHGAVLEFSDRRLHRSSGVLPGRYEQAESEVHKEFRGCR